MERVPCVKDYGDLDAMGPALRRYEELRVREFVRMQDVEKLKRDVWDCMQVLQKIVNDYSVGPLSIIR